MGGFIVPLCVGKIFLLRFEINIKWQKRFYEELLPFYCFCNGGGFIKQNEAAVFAVFFFFSMVDGDHMIHFDFQETVTWQFFQIIKKNASKLHGIYHGLSLGGGNFEGIRIGMDMKLDKSVNFLKSGT